MTAKSEREQKKFRMAKAKSWMEKDQGRKWEITDLKLPEGVEIWKPTKDDTYILDVIPYLADSRNPCVDVQEAITEGEDSIGWYERTFYLHRELGVEQRSSFVCSRCFPGKRFCPVCHWMFGEGKGNPICKKIFGQARILMNVVDVTTNESRSKGIQILNQAWGGQQQPGFGQQLRDKVFTQELPDFWQPEGGCHIVIKTVKASWDGGNPYQKITSVILKPRKYDLDWDLVELAVNLDDLLIDAGEDKLSQALDEKLTGGSNIQAREEEKEEKELEVPSRQRSRTKEEPEENGKKLPTAKELGIKALMFVTHEELGKCEVLSISSDGTSLTLEDSEGEKHRGISPSDVKIVEEEPEPEEPKEEAPKRIERMGGVRMAKPRPVQNDDAEPEPVTPKKRGR